MTRSDTITKEVEAHQAAVARLRIEHDAANIKLADAAPDQIEDTEALLDQIEDEIATKEKAITRLQSRLAAEAARNTAAARAETLAMINAAGARLRKHTAARKAALIDFEKAINSLAQPLARIERCNQDIWSDARAVIGGALEGRAAQDVTDTVARHLDTRAGAIVEAVARLIHATGLTVVGVKLDPYVTVGDPPHKSLSPEISIAAAAQQINERLLTVIHGVLERAADKFAPIKKESST